MNAPPFPIAPDVGEMFQNWVWNGARWVATPTTGLRVLTQVFKQSGPYMPSPGLVSCMVECIGGGGGGGGVISDDPSRVSVGGGGASGGYSRSTLPAALVRGGVLVTVGGVGGEGAGGGGIAGTGGTTSFGALVVAYGGQGGQDYNPGQPNSGGAGGGAAAQGIGDVTLAGSPGYGGLVIEAAGLGIQASGGEAGVLFSGGPYLNAAWTGNSAAGNQGAPNSGAGGTGAVVNQMAVGSQANGGTGREGLCVVTEFCWGDRDQPDIGWRPPLDVNVSFPKPPWPGGAPWPPGAWWPPGGWWGPGPWGRGPGRSSAPGPQSREALEYEAGQPYDQSINPETGQPWEDEP